MMRTYFEEVQYFRDNRWLLVLVFAISAGALLPLLNGVYEQLGEGRAWGDKPMSDEGLIVFFVFILITVALMIIILLVMKLEVRIDQEGVRYRFVPIKNQWQLIRKDQISEYRLENKVKLFQTGRHGYHRNVFTKTRSFRIRGARHLYLKLHTGEKFLLGTQNLTGMEWAMKKLMANNQQS